MVGDAGPDIGVARRAGVPVIGVEFGYTDGSDRRTQARPADQPYARTAGRGAEPDRCNETPYNTSDFA